LNLYAAAVFKPFFGSPIISAVASAINRVGQSLPANLPHPDRAGCDVHSRNITSRASLDSALAFHKHINIFHLLIGFFRCIFALCEGFAEHARKAGLTRTPERQEYGQRLKELAAVMTVVSLDDR
jgi:hypothetical protein